MPVVRAQTNTAMATTELGKKAIRPAVFSFFLFFLWKPTRRKKRRQRVWEKRQELQEAGGAADHSITSRPATCWRTKGLKGPDDHGQPRQ